MIINHPQYGEVFVAGDGTMYVNTDEGQVAVGNYNTGQTAQTLSNPNQSQGEADVNTMRAAGYLPDVSVADSEFMSGAEGKKFNSPLEYYKYLYGDGVTAETINGETWYKTPSGADATLPGRTPLQFNPPPSTGSQLVLSSLLALGAAGLGGALPGVEGIFGAGAAGGAAEGAAALGELGSGAYGIGAPSLGLQGAGLGVVEGGGVLGSGAAGVAGGSSFFPAADALALGGTSASGLAGPVSFSDLLNTPLGSGMTGSAPTSVSPTGGPLGSGTAGVPGAGDIMGTGATTAANTAATVGATTSATTAAQTGSVLSRIIDGSATAADWASLAGTGLSTGLGVLGANQQANAYSDVADKYLALGAPSRTRLEASYAPGFNLASADPAFQGALDTAAQAAARATSARAGNPVDNPGAYAEMQKYITNSVALPQLNAYRSQLGTFGNLGTNVAGTTDAASAGQTGSMYNALGYGLGQITQPQSNTNSALSDLLKRYSTGSTASF